MQYNDHNQKIQYGFDGLDNETNNENENENDQEQNFTREQEITDDKTTVKTVITTRGDELDSEPLSEEVAAAHAVPAIREDSVSIFSCYQCNITKVKLLPIITEDQNRAYCCTRCISWEVLDIHFEEFLNNSEAYTGTFHNYLDKQKA